MPPTYLSPHSCISPGNHLAMMTYCPSTTREIAEETVIQWNSWIFYLCTLCVAHVGSCHSRKHFLSVSNYSEYVLVLGLQMMRRTIKLAGLLKSVEVEFMYNLGYSKNRHASTNVSYKLIRLTVVTDKQSHFHVFFIKILPSRRLV